MHRRVKGRTCAANQCPPREHKRSRHPLFQNGPANRDYSISSVKREGEGDDGRAKTRRRCARANGKKQMRSNGCIRDDRVCFLTERREGRLPREEEGGERGGREQSHLSTMRGLDAPLLHKRHENDHSDNRRKQKRD